MTNLKRLVFFITTIILLLLPLSALGAVEGPATPGKYNQRVRVGFFEFAGYHEMDHKGRRSGYGYEYLQNMARYNSWTYEYVGFSKSWHENLEMLKNGEIDLLTSAQKTTRREAIFDFSSMPIGVSHSILTCCNDNKVYNVEDYHNYNGMRVGMLRGNSRNEGFRRFAAQHGFTYREVFFDDVDKMVEGMHKGEGVDAILSSDLRAITHERILAQFDPSPFYVIVRKGDKRLLDQVNLAIHNINLYDPTLSQYLFDKYYSAKDNAGVGFTADERRYVESLDAKGIKLKALMKPDLMPLSSFDRNGNPQGLIVDILALIQERSGIKFDIIPTENIEEYEAKAVDSDIVLKVDSGMLYNTAERDGFKLTAPYLELSYSFVSKRGNDKRSSYAMVRGNRDLEHLRLTDIHGSRVAFYDTLDDCLEAVRQGKQDATVLNTFTAQMAIYNDTSNLLVSSIVPGSYRKVAIGVKNGHNPLIISILNKAVCSISDARIDSMIGKYSNSRNQSFSLISMLQSNPLWVLVISLAILGMAGSLMYYSLQNKKMQLQVNAERALKAQETRQRNILQDALNHASRASSAKGEFMSRMSHEIRTPLNAVLGYLALAKDVQDPAVLHEFLDKSAESAEHLLLLVSDILDISSIESGKMKISNAPFDLPETLQGVIDTYAAQAKAKDISLRLVAEGITCRQVVGDRLRLNQVLFNLLSNSLKFTPKGGSIALEAQQREIKADKVFYSIRVSDTGCGMTPEFMKRIFTPFEQESSETAVKHGGSGLGLSVCKNLVNMMQGAITVESVPDRGSTFIIDIPFGYIEQQEPVAANTAATRTVDPEKRLCPPNLAGARVLLVEDNAINLDIAKRILEKCSCTVTVATNGQEAVEAFRAAEPGTYRLILMDIQMPVMNGYQAAKEIRSSGYGDGSTVPIIAMTANAFAEDVALALSNGMNGHLAKPINMAAFYELLRKYLEEG